MKKVGFNERPASASSKDQQSQMGHEQSLEDRLSGKNHYLRDLIIWQRATGEQDTYDEWTSSQKDRLEELFQRLIDDRDLGLDLPSPFYNSSLRQKEAPHEAPSFSQTCMFLTANQAFDIYAAHVAHVFYLEVTEKVPWSISTIPDIELTELLSSDRYHSRILSSSLETSVQPYYPPHIRPNRDFQLLYRVVNGTGLLGDPRVGYWFLHGDKSTTHQNLIGLTDEETIRNITIWFSKNVIHDRYISQKLTNYNYLQDRLKAVDGKVVGDMCYNSANLFLDIARSVNIPVRYIYTQDGVGHYHAGLAYRWGRDTRIVYHIDDIYTMGFAPFFPVVVDNSPGSIPRRVTDAEAEWKYFNNQWFSPAHLESWGFRNTNRFYLLPNPNAGNGTDDIEHLVFLNCDWPQHNRNGLLITQSYEGFLLERKYQLGSMYLYLDFYCDNPLVFYNHVQGSLCVISRSIEEFQAGARTCIEAYGGCRNIREILQNRQEPCNSWKGKLPHDKSGMAPRYREKTSNKMIPQIKRIPPPAFPTPSNEKSER